MTSRKPPRKDFLATPGFWVVVIAGTVIVEVVRAFH